jgi:hypothetical protein
MGTACRPLLFFVLKEVGAIFACTCRVHLNTENECSYGPFFEISLRNAHLSLKEPYAAIAKEQPNRTNRILTKFTERTEGCFPYESMYGAAWPVTVM